MKGLRWSLSALAAATLLTGCGEIANTLKPAPGSANTITVALDAPANFTQVGIFEAEALGYFAQTDLTVRFITPAQPLAAIESGAAQVAIASEPAIILTRNRHIALASVAAILQGPQRVTVTCSTAKTASKKARADAKTTATQAQSATPAPTPRSHPPLHPERCETKIIAQPESRYAKAPTYNGLDFTVTEHEIVNHAPVLRRFIQTVGRGYAAARADPQSATENLVKLNPGLHYTEQLAGVRASMANFFPTQTATTSRPWGYQTVLSWNAFGYWMLTHKVITNPDATPDADTNELLAGQGV